MLTGVIYGFNIYIYVYIAVQVGLVLSARFGAYGLRYSVYGAGCKVWVKESRTSEISGLGVKV